MRRCGLVGRRAPVRRHAARVVAGVLAACCLLSGCAGAGGGRDAGTTPTTAGQSSARAAAGLPECGSPASSVSSTAVRAGRAVVGSPLPDVVLACIGGDDPVSVRTLTGGRPHVINLWASWCRPCRAEAPMMAQVSRQLAGRVDFLGVDYGEQSAGDGIGFAQAAGWTYPQLEDPHATTRTAWGIPGLPATLLVRADGTVAYRLDGAWSSAGQLRATIDKALEAS